MTIFFIKISKNGNSEALADVFMNGAKDGGNTAEKISLYDKTIGFCKGCLTCQKTRHCVIHGDADTIVQKMLTVDVLVFATPIYYYEMSGQMKTMLDRANPLFPADYAFRDVYFLSTAADDEKGMDARTINGLAGWIECFPKARLAGTVFAGGVNGVGEIDGHSALKKPTKYERRFKMKGKLFSMSACIVAFTIILSGCASRQNNNDLQSSEPQSSKIVTSTPNSSLIESDSEAEHHTPLIDNEQSNVTDDSSSNDETSSERPNSSDSSNTQQAKPSVETNPPAKQPEENGVKKMNLQIGNNNFTATLESNAAVDALMDMIREAPIVIQMSDYSGFEKVGSLGASLPANNKQTTTQSGDIVLYNGNQIVIFYDSNSWSYTRLGKIDDLSGWKDALGSGDVTVTFSVE